MPMLIADTSPLVAMLNAKDKRHQARTALFRSPVIAPTPIITEVAYFLRIEPSPVVEAAFLDACARRELVVEATIVQDLARMADLVRQYMDSPQRSARSIARPSSCCRPTAGTRQGPRDSRSPWPRSRDPRSQSCQPLRGTGRQPGGPGRTWPRTPDYACPSNIKPAPSGLAMPCGLDQS